MTLRLHWSPDSANLPVRILLEMFGLPYEAVRVDRAAGENYSDSFREKNPQGLLPVLEDEGLVMFETGAIMWHLAEKVGRLGPEGAAYSDDGARTDALKWMFYLSNTVHADLRISFYTDRYIRGAKAIDLLRAGAARRIAGHFDLVEQVLYDGADARPTILPDIYLAVLARWAQLYPAKASVIGKGLERWPGIHASCTRIESHAGTARAFEAERIEPVRALTAPGPPDMPLSAVLGS